MNRTDSILSRSVSRVHPQRMIELKGVLAYKVEREPKNMKGEVECSVLGVFRCSSPDKTE